MQVSCGRNGFGLAQSPDFSPGPAHVGLPTQSPHLWAALLLTLRIKQPLILPAKVELFGNGRELQYGTSKLEQNQANKGEEPYFIEKKDEVGRGCFEQWSFGKKARVLIG